MTENDLYYELIEVRLLLLSRWLIATMCVIHWHRRRGRVWRMPEWIPFAGWWGKLR